MFDAVFIKSLSTFRLPRMCVPPGKVSLRSFFTYDERRRFVSGGRRTRGQSIRALLCGTTACYADTCNSIPELQESTGEHVPRQGITPINKNQVKKEAVFFEIKYDLKKDRNTSLLQKNDYQ